MKISNFLGEVYSRDVLLFRLGMYLLIVAGLLVIPMAFDDRLVMGLNPWVKPMKFCVSITIYVWTVGWILHYFPTEMKARKWVKMAVFISMLFEIIVILIQAARGTTSHYNTSSLLNGILFGIMGVMIVVSTLAIIGLFFMFILKKPPLEKVYYYSILIGLAIFLLACYMGNVMISNLAHSVGVKDGGAGLPFINWSTEGGDIRAAHFFGLHAMQIFPIVTYYIHKLTNWNLTSRLLILIVMTLCYMGFLLFVFFQAIGGEPLLG